MSDEQADLTREELAALDRMIKAAATNIVLMKRKRDKGYQGGIKFKGVTLVVEVSCNDGETRFIEPSEIDDDDPDVFVRDYVKLTGSARVKRVNVVELLLRFIPGIVPAGPVGDVLLSIFGRKR